MSPPAQKTLFVTGATGFLGHYLLAELSARRDVRCRVLLRPPMEVGRGRLAALLADLGKQLEDLARAGRIEFVEGELSRRLESRLLEGTDIVIHCAASTGLAGSPDGEPFRTNVEGTKNLLDAAAEAGVQDFGHVSTAFVCGGWACCVSDDSETDPPEFSNAYEQSKWEAERLVRNWGQRCGCATIFRPSILFGDRARGRATKFEGMYITARATELLRRVADEDPAVDRHRIPLRIAGDPRAVCNLVPVDWVAQRIVETLTGPDRNPGVVPLVNPQPPSRGEIKQWLEEYFDIAGGAFCDEPWPLPNPTRFEELFYAWGDPLRDYFGTDMRFPMPSDSRAVAAKPLVSREDFHRALRYAQSVAWSYRRRQVSSSARLNGGINPSWYFEEFLPRTIPRSIVARVPAITATVRFECGASHDVWTCRFDGGRLLGVHAREMAMSYDFGFRVARATFSDLISGRQVLQAAFFEGSVEILGDTERALRLVPIMTEFVKEHPAVG